jgi:hypothetical protein
MKGAAEAFEHLAPSLLNAGGVDDGLQLLVPQRECRRALRRGLKVHGRGRLTALRSTRAQIAPGHDQPLLRHELDEHAVEASPPMRNHMVEGSEAGHQMSTMWLSVWARATGVVFLVGRIVGVPA